MAITSLSMQEAALIAVSGFVTVLLVLSLLSVLVMGISRAAAWVDARRGTPSPAAPAASAAEAPTWVELEGVDELTAVCVMAVVSEKLAVSPDKLTFRRIRAVEGSVSA